LLEHLLTGPLLSNRTVILVTHHVDLVLPACHYLVYLVDGRVEVHGTPDDPCVCGLLHDNLGYSNKTVENDGVGPLHKAHMEPNMLQDVRTEAKEIFKAASIVKTPRKLVQDEQRETGQVRWSIYKTYLKSSYVWTLKSFTVN
jgi:ABC-type multidrug transport system ATPase subunit